jgi:hypothetical protein
MKHKIKVEMLPTDGTKGSVCIRHDKPFVLIEGINVIGPDILTTHANFYVYITVSQNVEPIKEGETYVRDDGRLITRGNTLTAKGRKVIATDDPKLTITKSATGYTETRSRTFTSTKPIPQVQQSFLKEFVANPNGEYQVEYDEMLDNASINQAMTIGMNIDDMTSILSLKLNQNNTVNITSLEEKMYSLEELIPKFKLALNKSGLYNDKYTLDWIKENL